MLSKCRTRMRPSFCVLFLFCISRMASFTIGVSPAPLMDSTQYTSSNSVPLNLLVVVPLYGLKGAPDHKNIEIERLALQAWSQTAEVFEENSRPGSSLRLYGLVHEENHCDLQPEELRGVNFTCNPVPMHCLHEKYGLPTMDCVFATVAQEARPHELIFYTNNDILFHPNVTQALSSIVTELKRLERRKESSRKDVDPGFMIVGKRRAATDFATVPRSSKAFTFLELESILDHAINPVEEHSPCSLDYFIFSPQAFPRRLPPILLGEKRWDNSLLVQAMMDDLPTVDASETITAVHLNLGIDENTHRMTREASDCNDQIVSEYYDRAFPLGRSDNTLLVHQSHSGLGTSSYTLIRRQMPANSTEMLMLERSFRAVSAKEDAALFGSSGLMIHLLVVYPGQTDDALKWACIAQNTNLPEHYLFLTLNEDDYDHLAFIHPNKVILEPTADILSSPRDREFDSFFLGPLSSKLLASKIGLVITEASKPHWAASSIHNKPPIFRSLAQRIVRDCDVAYNGNKLFAVQPSLGGLAFMRQLEKCSNETSRRSLLRSWDEDSPRLGMNLTAETREKILDSKDFCVDSLRWKTLPTASVAADFTICEVDADIPASESLPTDMTYGRTWVWDNSTKYCTRKDTRGQGEENPIHHAIRTAQQPVETKLHAVIVVGNPCGLTSRYKLAQDTVYRLEQYEEDHVVVYVVELAYGDQPFQVTKKGHPRHLQLRTEIPMWHKENMVNLAVERLLPPDWKAMAWIDGDVEFESANWAVDTLKLLNGHKDVVQLFSHAVFMDAVGNTLQVYTGYAYNFVRGRSYEGVGSDLWHPGFGWAYSRKAYDQAGGIYEREISGHGDGILARSMMGGYDWSTYWIEFSSPGHREAVLAYNTSCSALRMGYTPGVVRHYFHGSVDTRDYVARRIVYNDYHFDPSRDLKRDENTGVLVPTATFPAGLLEANALHCREDRNDDGDITVFVL